MAIRNIFSFIFTERSIKRNIKDDYNFGIVFPENYSEKERNEDIDKMIEMLDNLLIKIINNDIYRLDYILTWSKYYYSIIEQNNNFKLIRDFVSNLIFDKIINNIKEVYMANISYNKVQKTSLYFYNIIFEYYTFFKIKTSLNYKDTEDLEKLYQEINSSFKLNILTELNKDIKDYIELKKFKDSIGYSKDIFYYPKTIINPNSKIYKKFVTIQWRKVWPIGRTGQQRIMGNGPELAEALASKLPKHILIRLVDTAQLSMKEQIQIMKKTDFFIAEHGSGELLSIFLFLPGKAIVQEIMHKESINVLQLMASLSGHETYSDIIKAKVEMIDSNEVLFFDVKHFLKVVLYHMKKNKFNE